MPGPHDGLTKLTFTDVEHARGLVRSLLPPGIAKLIDWSTFALAWASFVNGRLEQRHADIVYRVRLAGRVAFVYVLLEHQSSEDRFMSVRLLEYMVGLWRRHRKEVRAGHPLPVVLPIVLHSGKRRWRAPTDLAGLFGLGKEAVRALGPHVPSFRFLLQDLPDASDESIRALKQATPLAKTTLVVLRDGWKYERLMISVGRWADVVARVVEEDGGDALTAVLSYIHGTTKKAPDETMRDVLAALAGYVKEEVVATSYEQLMVRERAVGRAGEARSILMRQLTRKFGEVDDAVRSRIETADLATLERWAERFATAATVAEVFEG